MSRRLFVAIVIASLAAQATVAVAGSGLINGRYAQTTTMSNSKEPPNETVVQAVPSKI